MSTFYIPNQSVVYSNGTNIISILPNSGTLSISDGVNTNTITSTTISEQPQRLL
jgi:hypothetical protein